MNSLLSIQPPLDADYSSQSFADLDAPDAPVGNVVLSLDAALRNLYHSLGPQTVLVAARSWESANFSPEATQMTLERSKSAAYQNELWQSDIAVLCGAASENLVAITVTNTAEREAFLKANPRVKDTLITANAEGEVIWIRLQGYCPPNLICDGLKWTSRLPVMVYSRKPTHCYPVLQNGSPVRLALRDLNLPELMTHVFRGQRVLHDCPFTIVRRNQTELNPGFVARYFADASGIGYDPIEPGKFHLPDAATGMRRPVNKEMVMVSVIDCLNNLAPLINASNLRFDARPRAVRAILAELKGAALHPLRQEHDGLEEFVTAEIEPHDGGDVTTTELAAAYDKFCQKNGYPPLLNSDRRSTRKA